MIRILSMIAGLGGALTLSQFPEFSQQYLQRLSGAVSELRVVVAGFDIAATASGLTREEALASMQSEGFEGNLKRSMSGSIRRYQRLEADLDSLRASGPLQRLLQPWNLADRKILQSTIDDFRPAVPVTTDSLVAAGLGYAGGWSLTALVLGAAARPFRRRRT